MNIVFIKWLYQNTIGSLTITFRLWVEFESNFTCPSAAGPDAVSLFFCVFVRCAEALRSIEEH